jgi:hypothetical protein
VRERDCPYERKREREKVRIERNIR